MIDLRNHYGFTRTPFGKDLAPSMLHHYPAHAEAVARITWCARERALAVITGEVGSGKTASARAAIAGLDQTRHTLIYLADPTTGTRGIHPARQRIWPWATALTGLGVSIAGNVGHIQPVPGHPVMLADRLTAAASPPCAACSASASWPPSTSGSPSATPCPP